MRSPSRYRWVRSAGAILFAVGASACAETAPSTLHPEGPGADRIAGLWWFMFWVSAVVVAVVTALILIGVLPGRRNRGPRGAGAPRWAGRLVVVGGVVVPVIILAVLWVLTLSDMSALSQTGRTAALKVQVIGHQWWWEVRYPQQGFATANDIHVPVGRPVEVELTTDDVIHSFWVPQLTGKTDLVSGRTTRMWIQADRPGVYRGQCAEYCGLQHANMIFYVVADSPARFRDWLNKEGQQAATPTVGDAVRGREVFLSSACVGCHTIRGTDAAGTVGPDLTHVGSRVSIGAGALANTPSNLAIWISDSQVVKPGNLMPPIPLSRDELEAVVAYLQGLK
ncbi:MAG TPA: cytochrome c oxidase subunit II [Actinomycetota bacterium]|nr:cytochrome c oxidase subunit II [Actinomycetota bacterium]